MLLLSVLTAARIVDIVQALDPLSDLPRAGWLLRGVRPGESIAEHCFGVALVAMLMVDALRAQGQSPHGEKVLRMALLHDAPEARTGDIPSPHQTPEIASALRQVQLGIAQDVLPSDAAALFEEYLAAETLESRIVKSADKVQMMVKAMIYEAQGRGALDDFWRNPETFRDHGIPLTRELFEAIAHRANRSLP